MKTKSNILKIVIIFFFILNINIFAVVITKTINQLPKTNSLKITQRQGLNKFIDNNGRLLRNHKFAGKTMFPRQISSKLSLKYRKPIKFNKFGYPDFSKYSVKEIKTMRLTGNHQKDVRLIEKILKQKNPQWKRRIDYTWHHHQDMKTMQYVPTELHSAIPHSGGASRLRIKNNN